MTVINLGSMTAVMDQPAKSAKLGLAGNADQVAFAISIALDRVRFTVQNKRRLQRSKHLSQRNTQIAICFKQAPFTAFRDTPVDTVRPNWLVLRIAPDEGISLQFEVKRRGPVVDLTAGKMGFHYDDWFPRSPMSDTRCRSMTS
jgi:glucose-6-phosphate 1-dehydrogenase